ncbi:DUF4125 family protein [Peptoniphilus sp. AGMB00490]|uniref:DUF4125 family protein n=2 Tax=Peptoniphilus TaxID=162289 RepID=A0ACD6AZR1_9FIRM|nr:MULTISPECIES: DUF4125 family protein [Peptoniphilus]NMW85313.1 DUF4125 family protein [Peptoniphilus faecalis]OLR65268.1 hypothetical protein BIV18_06960 [Peptoniphilus porci]
MYNIFDYIDERKLNKINCEFNIEKRELEIIKDIINIEWNFFDKVKGMHGRAICQDSPVNFIINRMAQYLAYNEKICLYIRRDYKNCLEKGINPVFGKYARMMQFTDINRYEEIKEKLPNISPVKQYALKEISDIFHIGLVNIEKKLPKTTEKARPIKSIDNKISSVGYFISEISFYNLETIWLIKNLIIKIKSENFIENIYRNTMELKNILS